jgi:hypothetical protein
MYTERLFIGHSNSDLRSALSAGMSPGVRIAYLLTQQRSQDYTVRPEWARPMLNSLL